MQTTDNLKLKTLRIFRRRLISGNDTVSAVLMAVKASQEDGMEPIGEIPEILQLAGCIRGVSMWLKVKTLRDNPDSEAWRKWVRVLRDEARRLEILMINTIDDSTLPVLDNGGCQRLCQQLVRMENKLAAMTKEVAAAIAKLESLQEASNAA